MSLTHILLGYVQKFVARHVSKVSIVSPGSLRRDGVDSGTGLPTICLYVAPPGQCLCPFCCFPRSQFHVRSAYDPSFPTGAEYATNLPAFCAVRVNVTSSSSSSFTLGLFLPTAQAWNGRFLAVGNSGFAGGINWVDMGAGLQYGFAVVSTDTGHNASFLDGSWAFHAPEKVIDYGYRALHETVVLAKDLVKGYYSGPIAYSYYSGCSTGGRQGLVEVQRYPADFDGVLVGAPVWWVSHTQAWSVKVGTYNLPVNSSKHIPPSLFPVISAEVFRQCDAVDGLADGIITNPRACDFHPETLLCSPSSNKSACLTSDQLSTLDQIYSDYVDVNQTFVFPHLEMGSEAQWSVYLSGDSPGESGLDYMRYWVLNDSTWAWQDYSYEDAVLAEKIDPGACDADNFDMSAFQARKAKILHYHGLADGFLPTGSSEYFYNHVLRALVPKGVELDDWYHYFPVPGMQHCALSVNDAPWYFAGPNQASVLGTGVHSTPGFQDPKHDAILALMQWVEKGQRVDELVATKFVNDTVSAGVQRQRKLCPYPKTAKYTGNGSVDDAASFVCM
ncbi:uncharacterized protein Z520_07695 [Fonsecaea multimorphosa CBS 102226]|uniref:Carboxylic ester hydrolase n=1 Tax=Fonsecaea multimorphosa CBS 102226 TaxID=1442371 RepID=A0A0D2K0J3_9EURO|nr:uncharacterized protein Z520_07695 [Fonsecaea multimorphosa CBS 102226]KIX96429.1 hypothetical protein Z520_07695 [Fonsecaea multimorphosa CBS 102226]